MLGQKPVFLAMRGHKPSDEIGELGIVRQGESRATKIAQLQVDVEKAPAHRVSILSAAGKATQRADFPLKVRAHRK